MRQGATHASLSRMTSARLLSIVIVGCGSLALVAACGGSDDSLAPGADPGSGAGASSGSSGTSGASGTSGSSGTSGTSGASGSSGTTSADGGSSACSGSADDPAAATTISGYMDKLPYNAPKDPLRGQVIDAIIRSCHVFAPPQATTPGWKKEYCWAHLVAAINKESGYNTALSVTDAYGTRSIGAQKANDPTVGLTQIRFSSTVRDYVVKGPLEKLSCVGCTLPASLSTHTSEQGDSAFWAVTGPTANMSTMQSAACNVGLGAWYYYVNATANGNPAAPTYLAAYCSGGGTAANLVTGLLSHLKGPSGGKGVIADMNGVNALQGTDNGAYQYVTTIKSWFDPMVGPVSGKHPFFVTMAPSSAQYCR